MGILHQVTAVASNILILCSYPLSHPKLSYIYIFNIYITSMSYISLM